jgi:hypothetical protein
MFSDKKVNDMMGDALYLESTVRVDLSLFLESTVRASTTSNIIEG